MLASLKPAQRASTASAASTGIRSSRFVAVRCQQGGEQPSAGRARAAVALPAAVAAAAPLLLACGAAIAAPEVVGDLAGTNIRMSTSMALMDMCRSLQSYVPVARVTALKRPKPP